MSESGAFPVRWFLGIPFTPMTLPLAAERIAARDPSEPFAFVTTPNAQHVVAVWRGDPTFRLAQDQAWMVLNDSTILGLLADRMFHDPMPVAAGSDLTVYLFAHHIRPEDTLTIIDKRTLETVAQVREPGRTLAHIEFTRDGRHALASVWEMDGAIVVYDAQTFREVKRLPMSKPVGKYNVFNKITRSEGTSH